MKNNPVTTRTPRTPDPADPRIGASPESASAYPVVRRTAKSSDTPAWQRRTHIPAGGPAAWQQPYYFPARRFPANDARSWPPALPIHTPQLYLWFGETEKPSCRRFLRPQHTFKFK